MGENLSDVSCRMLIKAIDKRCYDLAGEVMNFGSAALGRQSTAR